MKEINLTLFINAYLQTAVFVTCDSDENTDFTKDAKIIAENDCKAFIEVVTKKFGNTLANEILTAGGTDLSYIAPHDFFLTRNGHGAGFWDKPEYYGGQENADKLTEICQEFGTADVYHIKGKKSKLTF